MVAAHNAKVGSKPAPIMKAVAKPLAFQFVPSKDESKLNKTERAYLAVLRAQYGNVRIQSITLKLADDCRFTPDFSYIKDGRMILVDVKGFQREDALIKIKMAAREYSELAEFQIVKKTKNGWDVKVVNP